MDKARYIIKLISLSMVLLFIPYTIYTIVISFNGVDNISTIEFIKYTFMISVAICVMVINLDTLVRK